MNGVIDAATRRDLLRLLSGAGAGAGAGGGIVERLRADRARVLDERRESWWRVYPALRGSWDRLDASQQERIANAPEVWTLLAGAHYSEHDLRRWIAAENGSGGWTALGHRCGEIEAPRLRTGTIVDWQSPTACAQLPEIRGEAIQTGLEEACGMVAKIEAACDLLEIAAPRWLALMARFDAVLLLRDVPSVKGFTSTTTRLALGRPVLRNAHSDAASPVWIADALVHETVHTILDHVELTCALVQDVRAAGVTVRSGWSGRELDLNTFVQASMVWFALFHLWLAAMRAGVLEQEEHVRLLVSRARGFTERPSQQLAPHADALTPGVLDLVRDAEAEVLEALG